MRARAAPGWVRMAATLAPGPFLAFRDPGYDSHFFVDTGGTIKVGEKAMKKEKKLLTQKHIYEKNEGFFTNSRDHSPLILRVHWFSGMPFIILS